MKVFSLPDSLKENIQRESFLGGPKSGRQPRFSFFSSGRIDAISGYPLETDVGGDHHFFQKLVAHINTISQFEAEIKERFDEIVEELCRVLAEAASPYKKDMYAWRKLLAMYMETGIWLIDGTRDRPAASARKLLTDFDQQMRKQMVRFIGKCEAM